ncbi:MAG TPA: ribonuclease E/G, partial [Salinimicrobium catena]|nr:ribonuclease E/G [Salinimicrobium catena]
MNKELIIRTGSSAVDFALLKDGKLIELNKEEDDSNFAVGDIFLAKVRKAVPGLNAGFVNVGYTKDAFLHYHDLGPQVLSLLKFVKRVSTGKLKDYSLKDFPFEKDIDKDGSIVDVLKSNQSLLVQVVKEPISTKGPRISSELSLPGRYIVLVPFSNRISVSQKIESKEEKDRLKRLVKSIKPKGFGIIVRTVAEGRKVAELDNDLQNLMNRWTGMCKKLHRAPHPSKVLGELNRASSILRDVFNDTFTSICVDDETLYTQIKDYVSEIAPKKESIVKLYDSNVPIFEKFGIERQIKTTFGRTVSMNKGAYLVIEHTEAMHVIDVNSGNRSNKSKNQEDTALEVNLISATEIARQLRLRDMGGIIVVDFIDMNKAENRKALYDHLRNEMSDDRAKHKILPPSKFGLVQITRQRVRPEMNIKTREENPNKQGDEIEA